MTRPHLAQVNVARLLAPLDDPLVAEFKDALDAVNALAEASPGFVWRLQTEEGDATAVRAADDELLIVNLSVWESAEDLEAYVYRSAHAGFLRRKREWFERMESMHLAMWWVPPGTLPTVEDAVDRLGHIRTHGPTPRAFTFRQFFDPDGAPATLARARQRHG